MKDYIFYEDLGPLYFFKGSSQNWQMDAFHFHSSYEILLFMCDSATMQIQNRVYQIEKGDLFLVNGNEYHRTIGLKNQPYTRYVLMFEPEIYRQIGNVLGCDLLKFFEDRPDNFIHKINLDADNLITVIRLLNEIEALYTTPFSQAAMRLRITELLMTIQELFHFFIRNSGTAVYEEVPVDDLTVVDKEKSRISSIKKYIEEHIHEKLGLEMISSTFYVNKHYLSHYFKKETGFSISEYIKTQKIVAAKKLLRSGSSVTQTALSLGFSSDSHFISVFKQMTGTTPKKYIMKKKTDSMQKKEEKQ